MSTSARSVVTLLDVAKHAGVSLATASRVINGSDRRVSSSLRERVTASAEALRYVRNAYAQALARSRTSIAGVIVHDIGHPYFAGIVRGIERIATEAGQIVLICNTNRDLERELAYMTLLHEHRAATIIVAASGYEDPTLEDRLHARLESFIAGGGGAALVGRHHIDAPAVMPDNVGGMRELGRALVALGHREFAVIAGPAAITVTQDRLAGLRAAGVRPDDDRIVWGTLDRASGERAVHELYARDADPTAIVCLNDEMAVGALSALKRHGKRVPADVSLTGFDDIPIVADLEPPLTSVRIALEEIGERAMRLALRGHDAAAVRETVPTTVVLRESIAHPRSA